ncbi:MAG: ABC transporter ATP-binding protein [Kiloniellales bacterium]
MSAIAESKPAIAVRNLTVTFGHGAGTVRALRGISFTVAEGESFGLVGESGSGKSTVLGALTGLLRNWEGEIEIAGERQSHRRHRAFYKRLQMVFQDPYGSLHPRHTVDRILAEPIAVHRLGDGEQRIEQALADVGLTRVHRFRYPHQLSGGQRQRVAIARALILEPKIVLLDEPTSALDVSVQAEVLNLLSRLRQRRGLTYVMVSHNLSVVAHMCDRLAVMNHGRIVEEMDRQTLARQQPEEPYTRQLMTASLGYDREAIAAFIDYAENA